MRRDSVDVAVIGAGPAGLAAATRAADAGLSVVLLDEQDAVGGQIYRGIERSDARRRTILGPDYAAAPSWPTRSDAARHITFRMPRFGR